MLAPSRTWFKCAGASQKALDELLAKTGIELPKEYLDLLAFSNGGEGPLSVSPYNFCLDSAEDALKHKLARTHEDLSGFFVFGSNGGGEHVAFDMRKLKPWPVVAIDMTNANLTESVQPIAKDFATFLRYVGLEREDA